MGAENIKKLFLFTILSIGIISGVILSPEIWAIVEPHITITMEPGQTTKPLQIKDSSGTEVFSVDTDGTIFPSQGGGGVTQDIILGTPDVANFKVIDTGHQWFGIDNGNNNLNIVLGTTEPGSFTFEYTIKASDFPNTPPGWKFNQHWSFGTMSLENVGGTREGFSSKWFLNGVEIHSRGFTTVAGGWSSVAAGLTGTAVSSGDKMQLKAWSTTGSTNLILQKTGVYVIPYEIEAVSLVNTALYPDNFIWDLQADLPNGVTTVTISGRDVAQYKIGGQEGGFHTFYPESNNRMIFGETAFLTDRTASLSTGQITERISVPEFREMGQYRTTSK